jgi:SAM-dependent methyltransferase
VTVLDVVQETLSSTRASAESVTASWARMYDDHYSTGSMDLPGAGDRPSVGWRSGIFGTEYSTREKDEWAAGTLRRLQHTKPRSVLEVGAGDGVVAALLAPFVDRYVACDISAVAVDRLRLLPVPPGRLQCHVRGATNLTGLPPADLVVLNSVVHHFPDAAYLHAALTQALERLEPGGCVFVGDVPDLGLRRAYWLEAVAARSPACRSRAAAMDLVASCQARDVELAVDPGFFVRFAEDHGLAADVRLKPGSLPTEMNTYRYDVWLRPRTPAVVDLARQQSVPWRAGILEMLLDDRDVLAGQLAPTVVTGVPHPAQRRNFSVLNDLLRGRKDTPVDIGQLLRRHGRGVWPAEVRRLARDRGVACACVPSVTGRGHYDVVLSTRAVPALHHWPAVDGRPLTSDPARAFALRTAGVDSR